MASNVQKPAVDETRYVKFFNNSGVAIAANLVLVPDTSAQGAAMKPATGSVIKEIAGVTQRVIPANAVDGDMISLAGDTAVCLANGNIAIGDRVYVMTTAGNEGQVATYAGVRTNGAQFVLGVATSQASAGDLVSVRLMPHRVSEGRQFGTATLVAGTVTVSGVRISAATCNIRLTRNTPGGAVGDLSAPAASRNVGAGTFVINSASGTDTSTVDWELIDND